IKHYEYGSFAPMEVGNQAALIGWASMYRTAGRPDAQWRYDAAFSPESTQRLIGDKENCQELCQEVVKTYPALPSELDPVKRTALTDRMVELIANSWIVVPIIEGMGYYAVNTKMAGRFDPIPGRHELGDVFERIPRPEEKPWKK